MMEIDDSELKEDLATTIQEDLITLSLFSMGGQRKQIVTGFTTYVKELLEILN